MFKLQASRPLLWAALLVLLFGGTLSAVFFKEDSGLLLRHRAELTLACSFVLSSLLLLGALARFRFRHLWHHRPGYKRG